MEHVRQEQSAWVLIFWSKFRKDADVRVYESITGYSIHRMFKAHSFWWYRNCSEGATTLGGSQGYVAEVKWLQKKDVCHKF